MSAFRTLLALALSSFLVVAAVGCECSGGTRPPRDGGGGGEADAAELPDVPIVRTGECETDADCDDGDSCTTNLCDAANGECGYRAIEGCCSDDIDCDDGNPCTDDGCAGATCDHTAIAGCCTTDTDCNDGSECTRDACDTASSSCTAEPITDCCIEGATRPCYTGGAATLDVGECTGGTEHCVGARWEGICDGEVLPATSDTCDGAMLDEDCNGISNDGCTCSGSSSRVCYSGPAGTSGVGRCRSGNQTCSGGAYGPCTGEVLPGVDICGNGVDEDCSGGDLGCPPSNDVRTSAIDLVVRHAETSVTGTTVGATHDGPDTVCSCTSGGNVWYRLTLAVDSAVYLDTASTTDSYDTSIFLTDSTGALLPAQPENGRPDPGLCNDDSGCGGVTGWGTALQSRTWGFLSAGTYYVAVGGCGSGTFTLRLQNIPTTEGYYFYETRISGDSSDDTFLIGENRHSSTCGGLISGEDVRWFITCGGAPQFFSLCEGDGGGYTSRRTSTETTRWDPVIYTHSGVTGVESRCSSSGASGVDCRGRIGTSLSSTTFDTVEGGARLDDAEITRGINAMLIDERARGSGMSYRVVWRIRDR